MNISDCRLMGLASRTRLPPLDIKCVDIIVTTADDGNLQPRVIGHTHGTLTALITEIRTATMQLICSPVA